MAPKASRAQTTVTFDDRLPNIILGPYDGLYWENFYVGNIYTLPSPSGYQHAAVSLPNIAYNGGGTLASMLSYLPEAPPSQIPTFTLNSGYFTAAWNNGLLLTVTGYDQSTQLFQEFATLNTSGPSFLTFDWTGLTRVDFVSTGGTPHYNFNATQFAMDNVTINGPVISSVTPEPASLTLLVTGLLGVFGAARRKRKAAGAA